jgi:hypothetical protein
MSDKYKEIELPDTLGELFAVALKDARSAESGGAYLHMGVWLQLDHGLAGDAPVCTVCMAGAVMLAASTEDLVMGEERDPTMWPQATENKLDALDEIRNGNLLEALALVRPDASLETRVAAHKIGEAFDIAKRSSHSYYPPSGDEAPADNGWWLLMEELRNELLAAKI